MRRALPVLLCGCVVFLIGCDSGPPRVKVRGTVTLNGTPIPKGRIEFEDAARKLSSPKPAEIENGQFTADAPVGEVVVRIYYPKVIRQERFMKEDPNSPMKDIIEEQVPKKYNFESTLKETIKSGMADLEFKLVTK